LRWLAAIAAMMAACCAIVLSFSTFAGAQSRPARSRTAHRHSKRGSHTGQRSTTRPGTTTVASMVAALKLMNYYPADDPWGAMWSQWVPGVIDADMGKIEALGANTVRVIVQPDTFGYRVPSARYMSELTQMLSMAAAHGLKVQLTLFDVWSDYTDIAGSVVWARDLLTPFRDDPEISFVELQNEINPLNPVAMAWARAMLPVIGADSDLPVTVSVTGWNTAASLAQLILALGASQPDFYDLHFYGTPPFMLSTFQSAKRMAHGQPLLIGETGYSTAAGSGGLLGSQATVADRDQDQATYFADVEQAAHEAGLPPAAPWVLDDFAPAPGLSASAASFGLYSLDGSAKPAAAVVKSAFASF
jgi:cellulase (glycosyl hydrolase family 5)